MNTKSKCILSIKEYNITTRIKVKHVQKDDETPKCITDLTSGQEKD